MAKSASPLSSCFVFASAGSGKTKTLVDRYVKSLFFGIKSSEILCITFTNAAVFEMQSRISKLLENLYKNTNGFTETYLKQTIGLTQISDPDIKTAESLFFNFQDTIHNSKILTIHSFCQQLLTQFPFEAGICPNFEIIDKSDSLELIECGRKKILTSLANDEILLRDLTEVMSIYQFEDLVNLIQPQCSSFERFFDLHADLDEYRCILETRFSQFSQSKAVKSKEKFIRKTCLFLRIAKMIINEYKNIKVSKNVLDFADVLTKTEYLFTKSYAKDFVMSKICSKIKSIMIDEAQDLSDIQWRLISLFASDMFSDPHNDKTIFVVGDIKQSIYRFQGANYKLFSEFYQNCKDAFAKLGKQLQTVYLNTNYRSTPEILNYVDKVFDESLAKEAFDEEIISYKQHVPYRTEARGIVEIVQEDQPERMAKFVKDHMTNDTLILTRSRNTIAEQLVDELTKIGIEVATSDNKPLKEYRLIKDILAVADICIDNNNDYAVVTFLKSKYVFENPLTNKGLLPLCYNRTTSVFQNLRRLYPEKYVILREITGYYCENNLVEFFYDITTFIRCTSQKDKNMICSFLSEVKRFSNKFSDDISEFLKTFKKQNKQVSDNWFTSNKIRLSTIHGSKGLEAETVFLIDFKEEANKKKLTTVFIDDMFLVKHSQKEQFEEIKNIIEKEYIEEKKELIRLKYVALTRPKNYLYILKTF
jgi:ATP-dependent helicase/nuclease subunit A